MPRRVMRDLETVRLDLDGGDWVDLKKRWTVADRQVINDAMVSVKIGSVIKMNNRRNPAKNGFRPGHEPKPEVPENFVIDQNMNFYSGQVAGLKRGIVAWGGPGFCQIDHDVSDTSHREGSGECKPIPVNEEAIMGLDDPTANMIVEFLNNLNPNVSMENDDEEDESQTDPLSALAEAN